MHLVFVVIDDNLSIKTLYSFQFIAVTNFDLLNRFSNEQNFEFDVQNLVRIIKFELNYTNLTIPYPVPSFVQN